MTEDSPQETQKTVAIASSRTLVSLPDAAITSIRKIIELKYKILIADDACLLLRAIDEASQALDESIDITVYSCTHPRKKLLTTPPSSKYPVVSVKGDETQRNEAMAKAADAGLIVQRYYAWNSDPYELRIISDVLGRKVKIIDGSPTCKNGDRILVDHIYFVENIGEFLVVVPSHEAVEGIDLARKISIFALPHEFIKEIIRR
jgi:hypothetical protein